MGTPEQDGGDGRAGVGSLSPRSSDLSLPILPFVLALEHIKGLQVCGMKINILSCPAPYFLRIWLWQNHSIHIQKPSSATFLPLTTHCRSLSLTAGCGSSEEGTGQEPECVHWEPLCMAEGPGQLSQLQAPDSTD